MARLCKLHYDTAQVHSLRGRVLLPLFYNILYLMNNFNDFLYDSVDGTWNSPSKSIDEGIRLIDITQKQIILNLKFDLESYFSEKFEQDNEKLISEFHSIIYNIKNEFTINNVLKSIFATVNENKYNQLFQEIKFRIEIGNIIDNRYYHIPKRKYHIDKQELQNHPQDDNIPFELEEQYNICIQYLQQINANIDISNTEINYLIKNVLFNINLKTISKLLELLDINYDYKDTSNFLSSLEFNGNFKEQIQLVKLINKAIGSFAIENFGEFIVNISDKTNLSIIEMLYLLKKIQEHNNYKNQTKSYRKKSKNSKQKKLLKKINLIKKNFEYSEIINIVSKNINLKEYKKADGRVEYRWLCPFHQEKTTSFHIYNEGQMHCFGCQWTGNIIDYLQSINWRTLYETVNSEYFNNIKE